MSTTLAQLVQPWNDSAPPVPVSGLSQDSRCLEAGEAFIAIEGHSSDGHAFVSQAIERGASAVIAEHPVDIHAIPVVVLPDLARLRSRLADRYYDSPSRKLRCVAVTGTNGKTSVASYIARLLHCLGESAGYLGTIGWGLQHALQPAGLTTADAIECQRRLASLVSAGAGWVVMEVSSHALDQHRVESVHFETAVFTNLSRDHLDYHDTMAAYAAAKGRLFRHPDITTAVINSDDPIGRRIAQRLPAGVRLLRFGTSPISRGADEQAEVSWRNLEFCENGIRGQWQTIWGTAPLSLPLYGQFSVANAAAALAVLCSAGFALAEVVAALANLVPVPGRMEFFRATHMPTVVVDFAHTPDALSAALQALRAHCTGQLYCVVGCGGDRDQGKRPLMAAAAEAHADVICLTSDNPRSEDPGQILAQMAAGLSKPPARQLPDRAAAIRWAMQSAATSDVILVAGKGHENYQEIKGLRIPFSDRELVAQFMAEHA